MAPIPNPDSGGGAAQPVGPTRKRRPRLPWSSRAHRVLAGAAAAHHHHAADVAPLAIGGLDRATTFAVWRS